MTDFTEDEIRCLKKLIYKVREDEILELYKERHKQLESENKPFLVKAKDLFLSWLR
jgi:hypothetical protein